MTRHMRLTAADVCAAGIGGALAFALVLGLAEAWLRRQARP